ncbi:MAG: hypothetical protein AAGA48_06835 [Myxococcota bacterium]
MVERIQELLQWWPAVGVPVLVVGVLVLTVQQWTLSTQLIELRRDVNGLATEVVLLQQEVRQLRRANEDAVSSEANASRAKRPARNKSRTKRKSGSR